MGVVGNSAYLNQAMKERKKELSKNLRGINCKISAKHVNLKALILAAIVKRPHRSTCCTDRTI